MCVGLTKWLLYICRLGEYFPKMALVADFLHLECALGWKETSSFSIAIASLDALEYKSGDACFGYRLALVRFSKGYKQLVFFAKRLGPVNVVHKSTFVI